MSSTITWVLGLSGYALVAAMCGLILLEELGVPMPFAPGDLLLFIAGASIATGHVNPIVMVAAAYVSAVVGAVCGRELFSRIGSTTLPRIAALLHAGERVDRLTAKLRRGGSTVVFLGRVTPGMRIYTTELSGLVAMPRRTFLIGLAPAVALYEGVFIGLGAWLGRSAWATVEQYQSKPGVVLAVIAVLVFAVIGLALVKSVPGRPARTGTLVIASVASGSSNAAQERRNVA